MFKVLGSCVLVLSLVGCGTGLDPVQLASTLLESTEPVVDTPVASNSYWYSTQDYGLSSGTFTYKNKPYVVMQGSSISDVNLTRLNATGIDSTFGTAGIKRMSGSGGTLPTGLVNSRSVSYMACSDKVYLHSFDYYIQNFPSSLYRLDLDSASPQATDITPAAFGQFDIPANIFSYFCTEDYLIYVVGYNNPMYRAYVAVRLADDAVFTFYSNDNYFLRAVYQLADDRVYAIAVDPNYSDFVVRELTFDGNTHTIVQGTAMNLSNLNSYARSPRMVKTTNGYALYGFLGTNKVRIYEGSIADIHTALTTDTYTALTNKEYTMPVAAGQSLQDVYGCMTSSSRKMAFAAQTYGSGDYSSYMFALDMSLSTPALAPKFNQGALLTLDLGPWVGSGYVLATRTALVCSGDNVFTFYPKGMSEELRADRYTP